MVEPQTEYERGFSDGAALREQRISELVAELAPDGQKRVLYSQYIAVAEALEWTTRDLESAKSISAKRKDVLIEIRRLFYEAKFAPALEEGCVKSPVSEYVRLLIKYSKKLESELAVLRKANEEELAAAWDAAFANTVVPRSDWPGDPEIPMPNYFKMFISALKAARQREDAV